MSAVTNVVKSETLTVSPSAFITSEVGKFVRSNTRMYMALVLDVVQAHGGTRPAGYTEMLAAMAPDVAVNWMQYCTIITPAIKSALYSAQIREYSATPTGLTQCVKWVEDTARAKGYTLSLRDLIAFFNGKPSAKRAAELSAQEEAKILAQGIEGKTAQEIARAEQGAKDASAKQAREIDSKAASEIAQKEAERTDPVVRTETAPVVLERGPAVDGGFDTIMLTVHTCPTTNLVTVRGGQNLSEAAMVATIEALQMQLTAMRAALAETFGG